MMGKVRATTGNPNIFLSIPERGQGESKTAPHQSRTFDRLIVGKSCEMAAPCDEVSSIRDLREKEEAAH
jgi:hypothetical protein